MVAHWPDWEAVRPQPATAAIPGVPWRDAIQRLWASDTTAIQICPQSWQVFDAAVVDDLRSRWPQRQWYLHANLPLKSTRRVFYDASTVHLHFDSCFRPLAALHHRLGAKAYSMHAGRRSKCHPNRLIANVRRVEDLFGQDVAVEGMCPDRRDHFHVADSEGYRWLLESGLKMVIDVSHLHIVRQAEGGFDLGLLDALLQSDHCLEIHLSHNNGRADQHCELPETPPWWWDSVVRACARSSRAIVFLEARQRKGLSGQATTQVSGGLRGNPI